MPILVEIRYKSLSGCFTFQSTIFQSFWDFSGLTQYLIVRIKCLSQEHNTVPLMKLKLVTPE